MIDLLRQVVILMFVFAGGMLLTAMAVSLAVGVYMWYRTR